MEKETKNVEGDLKGLFVPEARRSTPQVFSDFKDARLLSEIIRRDCLDLCFDQAPKNDWHVLTPLNEA